MLPLFGALLLSASAWAGEHRALCEKVSAADLVYQMEFEQVGRSPDKARSKQWAPPEAELLKTAQTGKVTESFKGELPIGSPWISGYGIGFQMSGGVQRWDQFFRQQTFSKIYFLKQTEHGYTTTAWAEESAGCGSSEHWSWCPGFTALKTRIHACLGGAK